MIKHECLTEDADGSRVSAELQCSPNGDFTSSEQAAVEHFCRVSVSPVATNASSSAISTCSVNTLFFSSSANSSCGSVTIKTELPEFGSGNYGDTILPSVDGVEKRQEFNWNWDWNSSPPSSDTSTFTFNCDDEAAFCPTELNVLPVYPSYRADEVPSSVASLVTVLTPSELPTPVRCLLTPPDSKPGSPHDDPVVGETKISRSLKEVEHADSASSSPLNNNRMLVLTPVTRRPRRTHRGCTTIKYNRKNASEVDRRRVHFCDFPGTLDMYSVRNVYASVTMVTYYILYTGRLILIRVLRFGCPGSPAPSHPPPRYMVPYGYLSDRPITAYTVWALNI